MLKKQLTRGTKVIISKKGLVNSGQQGVVKKVWPGDGYDIEMTTGLKKGHTYYFNARSVSKVEAVPVPPPVIPVAPPVDPAAPVPAFFVGAVVEVTRDIFRLKGERGIVREIARSEVVRGRVILDIELEGGRMVRLYEKSVKLVGEVAPPAPPVAPPVIPAPEPFQPQADDRVLVVDVGEERDGHWDKAGWFDDAPQYEGQEGRVIHVDDALGMLHLRFDNGEAWWYPLECIAPVNQANDLEELFDFYDPEDEKRGVNLGTQVQLVTQGGLDQKIGVIHRMLDWGVNEEHTLYIEIPGDEVRKLSWRNVILPGENIAQKREAYFQKLAEDRLEAERQNPFNHDDKLGKFILWNPEADRPPQVIQATRQEAQNVARQMAERHGREFFVCKLESIHAKVGGHIVNKANF